MRKAGDSMAVLKCMLGNLKKRKSYSIVICVLILLAGLILNISLSSIQNVNDSYDGAMNHIKGPDLLYWINQKNYNSKLEKWFEDRGNVASVNTYEALIYNGAYLKGSENYFDSGDVIVQRYNKAENDRIIDGIKGIKSIKDGLIYLPYLAKTNLGLKVGSRIDYRYGNKTMHFIIAGFFEDPMFGGALIDVKKILVSGNDYKKLMNSDKDMGIIHFISVRLNLRSQQNILKINREFMKNYDSKIIYVNDYYSQKSYHLLLSTIALDVMIAFAVLLLLITLTVIRYAIVSTIAADFVNIGILKALGFTPRMIQITITLQYVLLGFISILASIVTYRFAMQPIGKLLLKSSGLYYKDYFSLKTSIFVFVGLIASITCIAYLTARKTNTISPVRAIAKGVAPNHFSSAFDVPLEKLSFLPFDIMMAIKQIVTKFRQYFLLIVISGLLAYALVLLFSTTSFLNSEKAINMLGVQIGDIELDVNKKVDAERLIKQITKDYDVKQYYYQKSKQVFMENERSIVKISDDFDRTGDLKVLDGRHPKHDNEIAISVNIKSKYKKKIGDYVSIKGSDKRLHKFLITGIFQAVDEGGNVSRLTESGMKILDPDFQLNEVYFKLYSHKNLPSIIAQMKKRYHGYEEISNQYSQSIDEITSVRTVFKGVSELVLLLSIIIIAFVTLLIMKVTVHGERTELGIYKAVGFNSLKLRFELSLRFLLVCFTGSIFGIVLEAVSGSALLSSALGFVGIAKIDLHFSIQSSIIAGVTITVLAIASAFIASSSTKSVTAYSLISE